MASAAHMGAHQHGATKVIVFGASGLLGKHIVQGLTSHQYKKEFHVTVALRADTINAKDGDKAAAHAAIKATGAHIASADVMSNSLEELTKLIAGYEIVISTLNYPIFIDGQTKLIEASKAAKTVKFFIPSEFGFDERVPATAPVPVFGQKMEVMKALRASGLNYVAIHAGFFMEFLLSPFAGVDIANATVTAAYSIDTKVSTTKLSDVGLLTAEILLQREKEHVKNKDVNLGGDTISFAQLAALLEAKHKKPFTKTVLTKEQIAATVAADTKYEDFPSRFKVVFGEGQGTNWDVSKSFPAVHAKHLKLTTVAEFVNSS